MVSNSESSDASPENIKDDGPDSTGGAEKKAKKGDYSDSLSAKRRKARTMVLQALYQWQLSGSSVSQIEGEFYADNDMTKVDTEYFRDLFKGIVSSVSQIDGHFADCLDRPVEKVDPIEKALLRMGTYELTNRMDVPYRVVLNEAIDLAKKFGGTDGHKYINSVLDRLVLRFRGAEKSRSKNSHHR